MNNTYFTIEFDHDIQWNVGIRDSIKYKLYRITKVVGPWFYVLDFNMEVRRAYGVDEFNKLLNRIVEERRTELVLLDDNYTLREEISELCDEIEAYENTEFELEATIGKLKGQVERLKMENKMLLQHLNKR